MKKILLITDDHLMANQSSDYCADLKMRLQEQNDMCVYTIGFGRSYQESHHHFTLPCPSTRLGKFVSRFLVHPSIYFRLKHILQQIKPDLIHLHNYKIHSISLLRALRPYPVVQTVYDFGLVCPTDLNLHQDLTPCTLGSCKNCYWHHHSKYKKSIGIALNYAYLQLRKKIKLTTDYFIAPTPLLAQHLKNQKFKNVVYIPPFTRECPAVSFDRQKRSHFVYQGELKAHQGLYLLLEEFSYALQLNPQLSLTIAGIGPEYASLKKQATALGIEQSVIFCRATKHCSHIDEAIALIFPNAGLESFGTAVTDAMSQGRPVIAVSQGIGAGLIDHRYTGMLFDPLKKGDLAQQILHLAANPDAAQKMGENAHHQLQSNVDNSAIFSQIVAVYNRCLLANQRTCKE